MAGAHAIVDAVRGDAEALPPEDLPAASSPDAWLNRPPTELEILAMEITALEEAALDAPHPDVPATSETLPAPADAPPAEAPPANDPPITVFGRVQVTISPVADFDRLLSLDSALARIAGVKGVSLADYAREEVVFRVDLEKPITATAFAAHLSETAGLSIGVTEAAETGLSLRIA